MRTVLILILSLWAASASANLLLRGVSAPATGGGRATGSTPATNYLLMVNGVDRVLQTDASSKICLASGC